MASRLLGVLLAAWTTSEDVGSEVLTHAGMRDMADKLCVSFKSANVEASVVLQAVMNLFFVGKWFVARPDGNGGIEGKENDSDGDGDGEEEENDAEDGEESPNKGRSDALPWLFCKLSYRTRSAQITRRNKSIDPVREDAALCHRLTSVQANLGVTLDMI